MKRKHIFSGLAGVLVLAAVGYYASGHQAPASQPPLQNLTAQNLADLQNAFNAAKQEVRVLLLLSPT